MIIKNIHHNDYEQYIKLINSNITREAYDKFIDNVLNERHQIIVLEIDGNLIGTGTLLIEPKLTYGGCKMGHIENVLITEKHRGSGYGELLVKNLLEIANEKKCYRADLNCTSELENFYKKNGFKQKHICMNVYFKENFN